MLQTNISDQLITKKKDDLTEEIQGQDYLNQQLMGSLLQMKMEMQREKSIDQAN